MEQVTKDNILQAVQAAGQYLQSGQLRNAEMLCSQILIVNPKETSALRMLAMLAFHGRRPNIALELLNQALSFEPQNPDIHVDLGNALLTSGEIEKAIAEFQAAIALRSDHVPALNNLSIAWQRAGNSEQAIDTLKRARLAPSGTCRSPRKRGRIFSEKPGDLKSD